MKKYFFLIIFLTLILYSCDKELVEDFIITNKYHNDIYVYTETINGIVIRDTIVAGKTAVFYTNTGYGNKIYKYKIASLFKYFEISSENATSKTDFLNDTIWEYKELSDTHAEYCLIIETSYFE